MFNISGQLAKHPEDFNTLSYKKMKAVLKQQFSRQFKKTSHETPVQFILKLKHSYPELNNQKRPLLILGNWKGSFKTWATKVISKEKDCLTGICYYKESVTPDQPNSISIKLLTDKGLRNQQQIQKALKAIIPVNNYTIKILGKTDPPQQQTLPSINSQLDILRNLTSRIIDLKNNILSIQNNQSSKKTYAQELSNTLKKWLKIYKTIPVEEQKIRKERAQKFSTTFKQLTKKK